MCGANWFSTLFFSIELVFDRIYIVWQN